MSEIWTPPSSRPNRRPVQLSDLKVCVLVHKETNRILCFAQHDSFAKSMARKLKCKVIEIFHAHDYDKYAKQWREEAAEENAAQDHAYLEREDATRQKLRKQLRDRLASINDGPARQAVESALHCLEFMEDKKKRYRAESFMVQEGFEKTTNAGEELVDKLILNK